MSARAGMVGKEESTWFSKTTAERANSSRWGVWMKGLPYVPRWSRRNVSETITTKLWRADMHVVLLRRVPLGYRCRRGGARRGTARLPDTPCWRKPRPTTSAYASGSPRKNARGGKTRGTEAATTSGAGREDRPVACRDRETLRPTLAIRPENPAPSGGPRPPLCCALRSRLPLQNKYHMLFNGSIAWLEAFCGTRGPEF